MGSGAEAWEAGLLQAPAAMSSLRRSVRGLGIYGCWSRPVRLMLIVPLPIDTLGYASV